jgi:acyl-[acyl-carrier-protein]-phospholipid O-acyltransferase/long-chain-fatty-acid--[acyl-carrier-protein] ligase
VNEPKKHPLRALLVTQFLGAFNDNAWKLIVSLLAIALATQGLNDSDAQAAAQTETSLAFIAFMLPMLLVSIPAGAVADRVSKRTVIIGTKALEVVLMACATAILAFSPGDKVFSLTVLALMGVQSGLFSPAKYGILPELLPHSRLSVGNGQLEMWTFLAIVGGTAAGGIFLQAAGGSPWIAGALLLAFAVTGFIASLRIPHVPAARAEGGVVDTIRDGWGAVRGSREISWRSASTTPRWASPWRPSGSESASAASPRVASPGARSRWDSCRSALSAWLSLRPCSAWSHRASGARSP